MATSIEKVELIDRIIFSRWSNAPVGDDVKTMEEHMRRFQQQLGKQLIYVGSVKATARVPNAEDRLSLQNLLRTLQGFCEHSYVIMEGNELQNNLIRVIISGVLIITRTYGDYLSVHRSADQVAVELKRVHNLDGPTLVTQARSKGLVL